MAGLICVLDIDGTIIGDVTSQVMEWEILSKFDKSKLRMFRLQLISHLRNGLLRPFLADFIHKLKKIGTENIYVYTASDDSWAQMIVPCIESAAGVKFNRPIFSRKHCIVNAGSMQKSLKLISDKILRGRGKGADIYKNIFLIDNNSVLIHDERKLGVLCPTYNVAIPTDVLKNIDQTVFTNNCTQILKIIQRYGFCLHNETSSYMILSKYYDYYAGVLKNHARTYKGEQSDTYWLDIGNHISKNDSRNSLVKSLRRLSKKG
jgi:hypothetical protein